jgi:hypothetical protein
MANPEPTLLTDCLLSGSYAERLAVLHELRQDVARQESWEFYDDLTIQLSYLLNYLPREGLDYFNSALAAVYDRSHSSNTYVHTCTLNPDSKAGSLYSLAWQACVDLNDIRYLHLISRLGHSKYCQIPRLFQNNVFFKHSDIDHSVTFFTSFLTETSQPPASGAAQQNKEKLHSKNSTFWLNIVNGYDLSFPIRYDNCTQINMHAPVASFMVGDVIGSFIGHIYRIEHQAVVPIYSDMIRELVGILILDQHVAIISLTQKAHKWNAAKIINDMIEPVRVLLRDENCKSSRTPSELLRLIPCGAMNNYGHTVINESSVYELLATHREEFLQMSIRPLLCNKDYLNSARILRDSWLDDEIFLLEECAIAKLPMGWLIDGIIIPLCSYLPTLRGIKSCWNTPARAIDQLAKESILYTQPRRAIYWSIGGRHGRRECNNILESIANIAPILLDHDVGHIILDSTTCIPGYGRNKDTNAITEEFTRCQHENYLSLFTKIESALSVFDMSLVNVNALAFADKAAICKTFSIPISVAPYGSSAMFPIYFLNNHVLLTGSEIFADYLEEWKWHITKYCHPMRLIEEVYIRSACVDSSGYAIDVDILRASVDGILKVQFASGAQSM